MTLTKRDEASVRSASTGIKRDGNEPLAGGSKKATTGSKQHQSQGASGNAPDDPDDGDDDERDAPKRPTSTPSSAQKSARFTVPYEVDDDPSHGLSMFTRMYQNEKDRLDGDPDSSFLIYRSSLLMNVISSKAGSAEAARVLQKTTSGNALKLYILFFGPEPFDLVENGLTKLAEMYEDDSSTDRAYHQFHQKSFASFRRAKDNKDLTEAEVVKLVYSNLLCWQMQLEEDYQSDVHLRNRMILSFSSY